MIREGGASRRRPHSYATDFTAAKVNILNDAEEKLKVYSVDDG